MKKLIISLLSIASFSSLAGEISYYNRPAYETRDVSSIRSEFGINKNLGRAWIVTKFDQTTDGPVFYDQRAKIEGLSYNSTSQEIVLDVEGTQIVCAKVKINFFGTHIKNTGACKFEEKYYVKSVDNGYEVEKIQMLKLSLKY